jgi:hypothetical protein
MWFESVLAFSMWRLSVSSSNKCRQPAAHLCGASCKQSHGTSSKNFSSKAYNTVKYFLDYINISMISIVTSPSPRIFPVLRTLYPWKNRVNIFQTINDNTTRNIYIHNTQWFLSDSIFTQARRFRAIFWSEFWVEWTSVNQNIQLHRAQKLIRDIFAHFSLVLRWFCELISQIWSGKLLAKPIANCWIEVTVI